LFATLCVCVGEIIFLPWFSKDDLSNNNWLRGVILIPLDCETIFIGWGFLFPIVLVSRYKLSLCHTPIKPDLLDFLGINVFVCGLLDCVFKRFTSNSLTDKKITDGMTYGFFVCDMFIFSDGNTDRMKRVKFFWCALSITKSICKIITDKPQIIDEIFFDWWFPYVITLASFVLMDYEFKYW